MFVEVGDRPLAYAGSSTDQLLRQLREHGYRLTECSTGREPVVPVGLTDAICRVA